MSKRNYNIVLFIVIILFGGYIVYNEIFRDEFNNFNKENNSNDIKEENDDVSNNDNLIVNSDKIIVDLTNSDLDLLKETLNKKVEFVYNNYFNSSEPFCGDKEKSDISSKNGGLGYYVSVDFNTYDEMINYLRKYMSDDVIGKRFGREFYMEQNGNLYCSLSGKGSGYILDESFMQIKEYSSNKIEIEVSFSLKFFPPVIPESAVWVDYKKYSVIFENINNNWIITLFNEIV